MRRTGRGVARIAPRSPFIAVWFLKSQIRFFDVRVGISSPTIRASRSSPPAIGLRRRAASIASRARNGAG